MLGHGQRHHLCCFCWFSVVLMLCLFFFFQAEDGIRDDLVTGVQTCALPIFPVLLRKIMEPPPLFFATEQERGYGCEDFIFDIPVCLSIRVWTVAGVTQTIQDRKSVV